MKTSFPPVYNEAMKKTILVSVLFFVLVSGAVAYNVDARIGLAWAKTHLTDPNPSRTSVSMGDADINGLGISLGTAVEYYNNTAFWADLNFVFPGDFKFDGAPIPIQANSYLFYTDFATGGAFTFDMKNLELYLGLGYSFCELLYRYNLTDTRYREYTLLASGPAVYLAAKIDLGKALSLQLTSVPKLTIFTKRETVDRSRYSDKYRDKDFLFRTGFEVNASLSLVYTF